MFNCGRCWDNPCTCGSDYEHLNDESLNDIIRSIEKILNKRKQNPELYYIYSEKYSQDIIKSFEEKQRIEEEVQKKREEQKRKKDEYYKKHCDKIVQDFNKIYNDES